MRLFFLVFVMTAASAFTTPHRNCNRHSLVIRHDTGELSDLPKLPAIGESSFGDSQPAAVVGDKFEIQYTCKKCQTRNSNQVSRIAYRSGVVICICKGCMANHWIADNLGWSDYIGGFEGDKNIEEYFANRGLNEEVNRVTGEVFELEKLWDTQHPFFE